MAGGTPGLMMSGWKNTVTHIAHWCVWLEHGGGLSSQSHGMWLEEHWVS